MGRKYTAQVNGVAVSAAQDIIEIVAPADSIVAIHDIDISQTSDVGDAAEEILLIRLASGFTTAATAVGSTPTAIPIEFGDAAFGGSLRANCTTLATAGTIVVHRSWGWNIRAPFKEVFTPETRPILSPSRRATIRLPAAPTDAITLNATITFEEIGG